jgi:hypothetical protein
MANKKFWLGMLVMVLVFGMTVVGCDPESTDSNGNGGGGGGGGTDHALNGTWTGIASGPNGVSAVCEFIFNNGNFEESVDGIPFVKGSYSTSGNFLTMTITHIWGVMGGLDSKWYTKNEWKTETGLDISIPTSTYSVNGNTLTITTTVGKESNTQTLTRK